MEETPEGKKANIEHVEDPQVPAADYEKGASSSASSINSLARKLGNKGNITHNPLKDMSNENLLKSVNGFVDEHGFQDDRELFIRGAILAQTGDTSHLPEEERICVERETTHKWSQTKTLYYLCVMCSMCAITQGADETVVNGAQLWFLDQFGLGDDSIMKNKEWVVGMVVGAPYLFCGVIGCFLTEPLNRMMGRRGVIMLSCLVAAIASIFQGLSRNWVQLFLSRLLLGLGIGPKSATVPVYCAETSPARIRGSLVMLWQTNTALGLALGIAACLALQPKPGGISEDLGWRLMLGSTVVPPLFVCAQVYFVPESPRWYIKKNRFDKAFESLVRLRPNRVQAARDLFYMSVNIRIADEINKGRSALIDIFKIGRNRRALYASQWVMFMQQFCGINVIAYYSTSIFLESGFTIQASLAASFGYGMINFLFAFPAELTIDTFGRRSLVLFTFPFLALFLIITGSAFFIQDSTAKIGVVAFGIYVYAAFYSPGMGPVPFTYSAEVFPLQVRDVGMSLGTATLWSWNFVLALTFEPLRATKLGVAGVFYYYAAWNVIGFIGSFLILPETKGLTLEEIDMTFSVPTSKFIKYQFTTLPYNARTFLLRQKLPAPAPLYEYEYDSMDTATREHLQAMPHHSNEHNYTAQAV